MNVLLQHRSLIVYELEDKSYMFDTRKTFFRKLSSVKTTPLDLALNIVPKKADSASTMLFDPSKNQQHSRKSQILGEITNIRTNSPSVGKEKANKDVYYIL